MISFLEKISISFVVITIVTIMIVLMFLDVNKAREDINGIKSHMLSLDNYQTKLSQIFFQISGTYPQLRLQEGLTIKEFGGKIKKTLSVKEELLIKASKTLSNKSKNSLIQ